MKTISHYYDYSSGEPFKASILEIRDLAAGTSAETSSVTLDASIFYPEGGGQPADRGTINGVPLLNVIEKDGEILHIISRENAANLVLGVAELILDADRRRDYTVHHTGQHLLSGTILRMTGAYTLSMHMGEETCTIDVAIKDLPAETLVAVEDAVQTAIEEDHPVKIHLCPPKNILDFPLRKQIPQVEEVIRVVEIQGCDFSPCCGTHLRSTGQIGVLRVLDAEKYKGMTRVYFMAGRRVLRDSRLLRQNVEIVSRALKAPAAEIGAAVCALLEKTGKREQKLKVFQEEDAMRKAHALVAAFAGADAASGGSGKLREPSRKPRVITVSFMDADMEEALRVGKAAQSLAAAVLVLASEPEVKFAAFSSVKDFDLRSALKDALDANHGRGGGGPSFFQGMFEKLEDLRAFMAAVR
ncbi:MAG: alanyl-tRNA editing protein [Treponema sp.]|jgi:alanyl-tRNA synthetase|nr:alanyl-tRNA editing protein [Treponema sp.]